MKVYLILFIYFILVHLSLEAEWCDIIDETHEQSNIKEKEKEEEEEEELLELSLNKNFHNPFIQSINNIVEKEKKSEHSKKDESAIIEKDVLMNNNEEHTLDKYDFMHTFENNNFNLSIRSNNRSQDKSVRPKTFIGKLEIKEESRNRKTNPLNKSRNAEKTLYTFDSKEPYICKNRKLDSLHSPIQYNSNHSNKINDPHSSIYNKDNVTNKRNILEKHENPFLLYPENILSNDTTKVDDFFCTVPLTDEGSSIKETVDDTNTNFIYGIPVEKFNNEKYIYLNRKENLKKKNKWLCNPIREIKKRRLFSMSSIRFKNVPLDIALNLLLVTLAFLILMIIIILRRLTGYLGQSGVISLFNLITDNNANLEL